MADPDPATPRDAGVHIAPVAVPKPAELLAEMLREKIFAGVFDTGTMLPTERDLVEQSQLSRAVVRDALAILKQQGLITSKPGRGGGSIVTRPTEQDLVDSLDVYLASVGVGAADPTLTETREVVDPWCAALAAARRTEDDLARLWECHEAVEARLDDIDAYVSASRAWHFAVGDAGGNPLLAALMRVRMDSVASTSRHDRYTVQDSRRQSVAFHRRITTSIEDRDPHQAYALMAEHVVTGDANLMERLTDGTAVASP